MAPPSWPIEAYCQAYAATFGLAACSLRFSNAYGPYSLHKRSVVAAWLRAALADRPIEINGDGEQTRDFVHADDLAAAVEAVLDAPEDDIAGELFQAGTGVETTVGGARGRDRAGGRAAGGGPARAGSGRRHRAERGQGRQGRGRARVSGGDLAGGWAGGDRGLVRIRPRGPGPGPSRGARGVGLRVIRPDDGVIEAPSASRSATARPPAAGRRRRCCAMRSSRSSPGSGWRSSSSPPTSPSPGSWVRRPRVVSRSSCSTRSSRPSSSAGGWTRRSLSSPAATGRRPARGWPTRSSGPRSPAGPPCWSRCGCTACRRPARRTDRCSNLIPNLSAAQFTYAALALPGELFFSIGLFALLGRKRVVPYSLIRVARRGILLVDDRGHRRHRPPSLDVALVLNLVSLRGDRGRSSCGSPRATARSGSGRRSRLLAEELRFGTRSLPGSLAERLQFRADAFLDQHHPRRPADRHLLGHQRSGRDAVVRPERARAP